MDDTNLFIPRDFLYINQSKLDSFFSQLYGGLVQSMEMTTEKENQKQRQWTFEAEAAGKFGLGNGGIKLLEAILGKLDISGKGKGGYQSDRIQREMDQHLSNKTLEHFQYALFEKSMTNLHYLIDLDDYFENNPKSQAGVIREKLSPSNFVKYTTTNVSLRDYRNAGEFVHLLKKIFDLSIHYKMGDFIDEGSDTTDMEELKKLATASLAKSFTASGESTRGLNEKFNAIVDGVYEFFNGELIPHDILLKSEIDLGKGGTLSFESQLKDPYLLENRTDLAYKYGFFEDTSLTIVGQITSLASPKQSSFNDVVQESADKIQTIFADPTSININATVKEIVKEVDALTKKVGILPLVDDKNIALTPIAIFREPFKNEFFS